MKKTFSIVIPIYKSELNLPVTIPYILEHIPTLFPEYQVELILINDGSPDNSWDVMKKYREKYPHIIRIANFIHNFGQEIATYYGIQLAKGDRIGVISADLQDPFELFAEMLKTLEDGHDLVCAVREGRDEKGIGVFFAKTTHRLIKRFINSQYPAGGYDFFVMNREMADRYLQVKEKNGNMALTLLWASSSAAFIPYTRQKREIGSSGWTFSMKVKAFIDAFVSNTYLPLRVMSVAGMLFACIAFGIAALVFLEAIFVGRDVPGWSSLSLLITFFSGLILMSLGIIGEYLWRIFDEVRVRPQYLVAEYSQEKEKTEEEKAR